METNETILTRKVVGISDRKVLGTISGLRVNCDTLSVSHYVASSTTTNSELVLPFEKALAVGDTFVTTEGKGDFLPALAEARSIVNEGFRLVGVEAYTKTGNRLGTVSSYAFDPVHATVTSIELEGGESFASESFVFFAPEFVFVDDGEKTAAELRLEGRAATGLRAEDASPVAAEPEPETAREEEPEGGPEPEEDEKVPSESPSENAVESDPDPDADLIDFLLGLTTSESVTSADGAFSIPEGAVLTEELIAKAREHDALLLLALSVED